MGIYLFWIGIGVVVVGYGIFLLNYFKYNQDSSYGISGFDLAKDITANYDNINIVESNDLLISQYHLKRNVIRLTKKSYGACDTFSLALASFLACLSLSDNVYLKWFRKLFPFMDFFNKSSLVMVIVSSFFYTKGDAKIGIFLGIIILVYQYFYLQIYSEVIDDVSKRNIKMKDDIVSILKHLYSANTLFFISSFIFILRFVLILLK